MWFSKIHLYAELRVREWTYLHNDSRDILAKVQSMKLEWVSKTKILLISREFKQVISHQYKKQPKSLLFATDFNPIYG